MARAAVSRLAVVPGPPEHLVVHGPRLVRRDISSADLRVHLQDRWGNARWGVAAPLRARAVNADVAITESPTAGWAAATVAVPAQPGGIDLVADAGTAEI